MKKLPNFHETFQVMFQEQNHVVTKKNWSTVWWALTRNSQSGSVNVDSHLDTPHPERDWAVFVTLTVLMTLILVLLKTEKEVTTYSPYARKSGLILFLNALFLFFFFQKEIRIQTLVLYFFCWGFALNFKQNLMTINCHDLLVWVVEADSETQVRWMVVMLRDMPRLRGVCQ